MPVVFDPFSTQQIGNFINYSSTPYLPPYLLFLNPQYATNDYYHQQYPMSRPWFRNTSNYYKPKKTLALPSSTNSFSPSPSTSSISLSEIDKSLLKKV